MRKLQLLTLRCATAVLISSAGVCVGVAQDAVPSPTISPAEARYLEKKRQLEQEKELAALEAEIARSRKAELDAGPKAKATPNDGALNMTGEDAGYDIIVYRELGKVTTRVANSVRQTVPAKSTISVFDDAAFADWMFYRRSLPIFRIVIGDLTADYCRIARKENDLKIMGSPDAIGTGLATTGNLIGQFADILSYFKTQTTMTGKAVNINQDAVVASLYSELRRSPDLTLLFPKTFAPETPVFCGQRTVTSACCASGPGCTETKEVYCSEVANLLESLYAARRAAFASKDQSPELKKLDAYFAEFLGLLATTTPTSTETSLNKYLAAEQFEEMHKRTDIYFLDIKSVRAVGTQRIRKNLFFLTDKLDYAGGIVLQWMLFDKAGKVVGSGIETSYDGFVSPKDLKGRP